jgi:hypothetical protein
VKKTGFQPPGEPVVLGDEEIGHTLALALACAGEVDRATHGFHTWPAGLHPDAAALLVEAFPGRSLLDPFCGGGTVLVEGRVAGRRVVGRDVSPIALLIARGRAATPDEALLTRVRSTARKLAEAARHSKDPPPPRILEAVKDWYQPHVLHELEALRRGISNAEGELRPYLWLCFSSILVKASFRESDTSARREKHHRPPGTTAILFHKKVREYGRRVADLRGRVPEGTPEADVAPADARRVALSAPVDLVLTSPPYPSTYDYLPMQHLRTVWLGLDEGQGEIGSRRSFRQGVAEARRRWIEDTREWTARAAAALGPGGPLVIVIGDGLTPSGSVDTSEPTEDAARAAQLASVARASVERIDHARGTSRWEHAFAFRRE